MQQPWRIGWTWQRSALLVLGVMLAMVVKAELPKYLVHPGDKLMVTVYDDPKLPPMEITVTPDGKFGFPMVGEVTAAGRTTEQIRLDLEVSLKRYLAEPIVNVTVTDARGNVAYVIGQVTKSGAVQMNPGINVLQALSVAGGMTPYAKSDEIIIIRSVQPAQQTVLPFRYGQVSAGKRLEQNIQLESGDVVVVP